MRRGSKKPLHKICGEHLNTLVDTASISHMPSRTLQSLSSVRGCGTTILASGWQASLIKSPRREKNRRLTLQRKMGSPLGKRILTLHRLFGKSIPMTTRSCSSRFLHLRVWAMPQLNKSSIIAPSTMQKNYCSLPR